MTGDRMWRTTGWRRAMEEAAGKSPENPKVKKLYSKAEQILADAASPEKLKGNPYKGKPLNFDRENPFEKEFSMGNRLLKNAGYRPPWIEVREEILAEKRALRRALDQHLAFLERALEGGSSRTTLRVRHDQFLEEIRDRIEKLHREIVRFNLEVPIIDQQVVNIRFESFTREMRSAAERLLALE